MNAIAYVGDRPADHRGCCTTSAARRPRGRRTRASITGPKSAPDPAGAAALDREQHGQDRRRRSGRRGGPGRGRDLEALDGGEHRDRRRDDAVAVEEGGAENAEQRRPRAPCRAARRAAARTSAASAITPPSPSLSARMTMPTYLTETMSVIDQNIIEITPKTSLGGRPDRAAVDRKTVCRAYSGLVPMSPKTTPSAATTSAGCTDRTGALRRSRGGRRGGRLRPARGASAGAGGTRSGVAGAAAASPGEAGPVGAPGRAGAAAPEGPSVVGSDIGVSFSRSARRASGSPARHPATRRPPAGSGRGPREGADRRGGARRRRRGTARWLAPGPCTRRRP